MAKNTNYTEINITPNDIKQLRFEYEEGLKTNLKSIFFKFENAPEKWADVEIEFVGKMLIYMEDSNFASLTIDSPESGEVVLILHPYAESKGL